MQAAAMMRREQKIIAISTTSVLSIWSITIVFGFGLAPELVFLFSPVDE
jgi:hypothetical protein